MSRNVSTLARQALFASRTDQVFVALLTITHAEMSTQRLACAGEDITSRGNVYTWMPFIPSFPEDTADGPVRASLTIHDPSRVVVNAVRELSSAPQVTMEIVLASQPDTVDAGPWDFTLKSISWDALTLTGVLSFEDIYNEPYPGDSFTPAEYPGLF